MKSIQSKTVFELEINKSIFIGYLFPVQSAQDAQSKLQSIKEEHPTANHHCYAYLIGENHEIQKYSDDGEPSRTAGFPMLEVLKKNELTNVLTISVRYFGGIKLGAGGLVRAYSKSVSGAIELATFTTLKTYYTIEISIPFDLIGIVERVIRDNYDLKDTTYSTGVTYTVRLLEEEYSNLNTQLTNHTKGVSKFQIINTSKEYN